MKNCIITGSGRSGTSMMAGILYNSGYYLGDDLHKANLSNPVGFFESKTINKINEEILIRAHKTDYYKKLLLHRTNTVYSPGRNQHWLYLLKTNIQFSVKNKKINNKIKNLYYKEPFCFKDPRFSYTLNIWDKNLPSIYKVIIMFRNPNDTVDSILNECQNRAYLNNFQITATEAFKLWTNLYSYILKSYRTQSDDYIFVNYNQLVKNKKIQPLSDFLEVKLNINIIDTQLRRTKSTRTIPNNARDLYKKMCYLSEKK